MTVCKMMGHAPSVAAEFYHQIHESEIKAFTGGTDPLPDAQAEIARLTKLLEENAHPPHNTDSSVTQTLANKKRVRRIELPTFSLGS